MTFFGVTILGASDVHSDILDFLHAEDAHFLGTSCKVCCNLHTGGSYTNLRVDQHCATV